MIKETNDSNFEKEVLGEMNKPVVVDFWASWCGPCKMLAPVMEEVEGELKDQVNFYKVNVDENPVVSQNFRIASIPTVMIFSKGKAVDALVGFRPKQSIVESIKKHI